jgi:hypothetical protein
MQDDFDRWLEDELRRGSSALARRPVPAEPRYLSVRRHHGLRPLSRGVLAVLSAVTLAGGGAAAAAASGSPTPQLWGQQVQAVVSSCRDSLSAGFAGVGDCVSATTNSRPSPTPAIAATSPAAAVEAQPPSNPTAPSREDGARPSVSARDDRQSRQGPPPSGPARGDDGRPGRGQDRDGGRQDDGRSAQSAASGQGRGGEDRGRSGQPQPSVTRGDSGNRSGAADHKSEGGKR